MKKVMILVAVILSACSFSPYVSRHNSSLGKPENTETVQDISEQATQTAAVQPDTENGQFEFQELKKRRVEFSQIEFPEKIDNIYFIEYFPEYVEALVKIKPNTTPVIEAIEGLSTPDLQIGSITFSPDRSMYVYELYNLEKSEPTEQKYIYDLWIFDNKTGEHRYAAEVTESINYRPFWKNPDVIEFWNWTSEDHPCINHIYDFNISTWEKILPKYTNIIEDENFCSHYPIISPDQSKQIIRSNNAGKWILFDYLSGEMLPILPDYRDILAENTIVLWEEKGITVIAPLANEIFIIKNLNYKDLITVSPKEILKIDLPEIKYNQRLLYIDLDQGIICFETESDSDNLQNPQLFVIDLINQKIINPEITRGQIADIQGSTKLSIYGFPGRILAWNIYPGLVADGVRGVIFFDEVNGNYSFIEGLKLVGWTEKE